MAEDNLGDTHAQDGPEVEPQPDPGNSGPEAWTEDLSDDDAREAYRAVEQSHAESAEPS